MATYGLKYKAEWRNSRGQDYRLRVYRRDYSGGSKTIGGFCGCALEVQGAQGRIIDPIVKTQLRFSMVDAWDQADTSSVKYGDWTEFFTPDATLYKVVLYSLSGSTATEIWTGYITPDSWHEDLDYRGIITITARDNIGHLKDFPFSTEGFSAVDENGLAEIRDVIYRAMEVIDFPMSVSIETAGPGQHSADTPCTEDGDYLTEALVNVSLFEGMDWYAVLEQTLEAIGFAFRFVGGNKCFVCSLRNLPILGHVTEAVGSQTMEFYGGSLELDPAVKMIEEEQDYKFKREIDLEIFAGLTYTAPATTYRCKTDGNTLPGGGTVSIAEHDAPTHTVNANGRTPWVHNTKLLDPSGYLPDDFLKRSEGEDGWKRYIFIPGNYALNTAPYASNTNFRFVTKTGAIKITFHFTEHALTIRNSGSMSGKMQDAHYSLAEIKYGVNYLSSDGTVVRHWNGGSWDGNGPYALTKTFDAQNENATEFELELGDCADIDGGLLVVFIYDIKYKCWSTGGDGCYARVASVTTALLGTTSISTNKVKTVNDEAYNVLMTRRPLFGALSKEVGFVLPDNYPGGLFYYPFVGSAPQLYPYTVRFTDYAGGVVPLPVLVHEQILCYYLGAARVLSGSCAPINKVKFDFGKLCTYKGVSYLFQGGTLDLFSGIVTGAVLREYADFSTVWSGGAPTYSEEVIYNN